MGTTDRSEFAAYLRRRRAMLPPPEPAGGGRASRRRVPGLRRQELAALANISVEYYTRLEQGRATRASREILTALSRAFELTDPERDHLFRLGGEVPPEPAAPQQVVRPGLLRMVYDLGATTPVTVHDGRLDLLARNEAAAELLAPLERDGPHGRNIVFQAFTAEDLPALLGDDGADLFLRVAAAELRTALSRYPGDAYLGAIRDELTATSATFRERWDRGEVSAWKSAVKDMHRPGRGWTRFGIEILHEPERDHWVMLYTPTDRA
ncbi:helix-turn-helix domain-containing protein [Saccharopolyspora sp. 6M]|uniref:helix-turn-helix domain-containing protein n=1 Tax=Saccharopolyspora sp. 6M TaxID=2877237 RepID=UPI001CD4C604|nr:helix-turn-helix transcriptional regulator [Saccharopolyspora sp. 6M]MCA1226658.1 helix-turn-helix transcriptional regulator [Saccharopolyspora sp. 6M]